MQPAWRQGGAGLDRAAGCDREAVSGEDRRGAGAVGGNHIAAGAAGAYAWDDRADGLPAAAAVSIWRDGTVGRRLRKLLRRECRSGAVEGDTGAFPFDRVRMTS